jgi:hypothetical protein
MASAKATEPTTIPRASNTARASFLRGLFSFLQRVIAKDLEVASSLVFIFNLSRIFSCSCSHNLATSDEATV